MQTKLKTPPQVVAHHQKIVASDSSKEPRILENLGPVLSRFLKIVASDPKSILQMQNLYEQKK